MLIKREVDEWQKERKLHSNEESALNNSPTLTNNQSYACHAFIGSNEHKFFPVFFFTSAAYSTGGALRVTEKRAACLLLKHENIQFFVITGVCVHTCVWELFFVDEFGV